MRKCTKYNHSLLSAFLLWMQGDQLPQALAVVANVSQNKLFPLKLTLFVHLSQQQE